MPTKPRILLCNDAHFLFTGYAKYGKFLLEHLTNTDKFDVAELACYANIGDSRDINATWHYYVNSVNSAHPLFGRYQSNPQNKFGRWRFDRVCLDFKPDIVCDLRDPWMLTFEELSPLREFFSWIIMPTVDSAPQRPEWLNVFAKADGVFTYSDWGLDVLKEEGNNSIKTVTSAPPGCDIETFYPIQDKQVHKQNMGFIHDANIIGTLMRNQPRKLYPDLFEAFRKFIQICYDKGDKDLADRTYLYTHCSYPDNGWEIPELLIEHEISHKVLFTYLCNRCDKAFCSFFRDSKTVCPSCNQLSATLPNTVHGLTQDQLAKVLNMFDVYIQYSVCEGFGMPQVEATSCGVPLMSVDYSAMSDVVRKTGGISLQVQRMYRDVYTGAYRALPDNDLCAQEIYRFFTKPEAIRRRMGNKARKATETYYTWENTVKIWEQYLENLQLVDNQGKWDIPKRNYILPKTIPQTLNNAQFINWAISKVMMEPKLVNSRYAATKLRQLDHGSYLEDESIIPVTKESIFRQMLGYAQNKIECENARVGHLELSEDDYIKYAHQRAKFL